jgi:hypothetical protein
MLFDALPVFPVALPDDELSLLAKLKGCDWPTNQALEWGEHAAARRLESRGLLKISRQKDDPIASYPTWYAGKTPTAALRTLSQEGAPK